MDAIERANDRDAAIRLTARQALDGVWTTLPATVSNYNATARTVDAQPTIQALPPGDDATPLTLPLCLDCPVQFPGGGGVTLTFPLKSGDEGLLIFSARCIDSWWQSGGVQPQAELRMHDLSDGFFIPRVWSQPNLPAHAADTMATQLVSDDGATLIALDPGGKTLTLTAPSGGTVNADVTIKGKLHVTGAATFDSTVVASGEVTGNGIKLSSHKHGLVKAGTDISGGPV